MRLLCTTLLNAYLCWALARLLAGIDCVVVHVFACMCVCARVRVCVCVCICAHPPDVELVLRYISRSFCTVVVAVALLCYSLVGVVVVVIVCWRAALCVTRVSIANTQTPRELHITCLLLPSTRPLCKYTARNTLTFQVNTQYART